MEHLDVAQPLGRRDEMSVLKSELVEIRQRMPGFCTSIHRYQAYLGAGELSGESYRLHPWKTPLGRIYRGTTSEHAIEFQYHTNLDTSMSVAGIFIFKNAAMYAPVLNSPGSYHLTASHHLQHLRLETGTCLSHFCA